MRQKSFTSRRPVSQHSWVRRHIVTLLILLLAVAFTALFISYSNWKQIDDAKKQSAQQQADFKVLDKKIALAVQRKIDAARKAEAEAKARAEEDKKKLATSAPLQVNTALCGVANPGSITAVINKKHCFNPSNYAPSDLASVNGYLLRTEAANQLIAMMNAAAAAGLTFDLSSTYRSYENQVITYSYWVATNGSIAAADTVSARPGYSEHQTGLAADLKTNGCALDCFGSTAQYTWLQQNAANYGYIERYPAGLTSITGYAHESWHWRYVGTATAQDMKAKGIQALESYFGISGGDYAG